VPRTPMTGEEEDTDVGFPGPGHFIAEREPPMRLAMGTLALLATVGGLIEIPGVDSVVERFLEPTFADSRSAHTQVSTGAAWVGLVIGAVVAVTGITLAYRIWVGSPGIAIRARERLGAGYPFLHPPRDVGGGDD